MGTTRVGGLGATEPKAQFLLPRIKGKKSWNARISTVELSGRSYHFLWRNLAYSSYAGSVFYPGYTLKIFHRKSVWNVIVLSRKSHAVTCKLHQFDKASEETIITSDKFVFFETPIWLVIS